MLASNFKTKVVDCECEEPHDWTKPTTLVPLVLQHSLLKLGNFEKYFMFISISKHCNKNKMEEMEEVQNPLWPTLYKYIYPKEEHLTNGEGDIFDPIIYVTEIN